MAARATLVLVVFLLVVASVHAAPGAVRPAFQTRPQAEVHVLAIVARSWRWSHMPGLVDPRSGMLRDNTQAICRGRGPRKSGPRFSRFLCVVRPYHHRPNQGLFVTYRALSGGRASVHWLAYRR